MADLEDTALNPYLKGSVNVMYPLLTPNEIDIIFDLYVKRYAGLPQKYYIQALKREIKKVWGA